MVVPPYRHDKRACCAVRRSCTEVRHLLWQQQRLPGTTWCYSKLMAVGQTAPCYANPANTGTGHLRLTWLTTEVQYVFVLR